ncbi:putative glyoxalase/Bleomycin resistance protein/Dihydroxybiphenyl dioxygenase [Rosa chinensis]|uniref:Putative glyoxalase/Bleomycin resistance protein/Dihydroxybiphenyl dioxygenase n=1 Tax=Rosa chinensis TaxID=74649 RepID=A0A2P6QWQ5_ROSCH|nr:putative glyoxalase/Bleomycin resistance protein/Dihydroxybiphenyl dioxygenase [Rosa chinensis]
MAATVAQGLTVDHIARQSNNIRRLADFYIEIFGFEEVESPKFGPLKVMWLILPSAFTMHLIECNPTDRRSGPSLVADPADIPRGHHMVASLSPEASGNIGRVSY